MNTPKKKIICNKKKSSRVAALEILHCWQQNMKPINPIIERLGGELSELDRHLVNTMVNGVLANMEYLDIIIAKFSGHPLAKMKTLTLTALRLGIFQLVFLDRVPDSAAVNETVKAFKGKRQPKWLINFVNGVLRTVTRKKKSLPDPDMAGENGTPVLNHPRWLLKRWEKRYGREKVLAICNQNNQKAPLSLRVNTRLTTSQKLEAMLVEQGWSVQKGRYAADSLLLDSFSGSVKLLPGFSEGYFQVQDEAAQLAACLLGPFKSDQRYLDGCAGLGGKTGYIAQLLPEGASLEAVEPEQFRVQKMTENLQRLQLTDRVKIYHGDLNGFASQVDFGFDAVLVDAPCSGTGVIRKHPDMRWNRTKEDLEEKQQLQLNLLTEASSLVLPGGTLVYATCSMEPEENQEVIASFLKNKPGFSLTPAQDFLPPEAITLVDAAGYFSSTPADGLDGFFAARLVAPS